MAKYGHEKRDFQVGDFWLSKQRRSEAWCRTWYDNQTRQTKKASLGTTDFEEAKELLTDWFVSNRNLVQEKTGEILIADVLLRYWEKHACNIPSATQAKISIQYWLEFYGDNSVSILANFEQQDNFQKWLLTKKMKPTTISRVLSVGRAAINRAWKHGEIESAPFIHDVKSSDLQNKPPRGRPMEANEIIDFFNATENRNLQQFIILMLATAARPDAVMDLQIGRCDIDNRLIILNPPGRAQTKKYRPTIKMPESIVPLLGRFSHLPADNYIFGGDAPIKSLRSAWRRARERAELDKDVNPYSLRHTMARWLRKQGVPAWEISAQLGHKQREMTITEVYAPHDPSYLANSAKAIDLFFEQLRVNCVGIEKLICS